MDFSTAKDLVVKRVHNDDNASFLTLAGEFLNEVMHDIVEESNSWSWLEEDGTLALVADTSSYSISSIGTDVARILTISIEDPPLVFKPKDVFSFTIANADPDAQSGTPRFYTIWDDNILLSPVPDESFTANVRYYQTVEDLSDSTDEPPWPARFNRVWITGARALMLDYVDDVRAEIAQASYERMLAKMMGGDGIHIEEEIIAAPYSRGYSDDIDHDPTGPLAGILW